MTPKYPPYPVPAASAVVLHQGRLLLVQRSKEPGAGQWSLPGGKIELGETAGEAAARETLEETGIRIKTANLLDAVDVLIYDDSRKIQYHYLILVYLGDYLSGAPQPSPETSAVLWVSPRQALEFNLTSTARSVIKSLVK